MKDILTQKAYKDYTYISRYSVFPYYYNRIDQKYIYGLTSQLKKDTNFVSYKVKKGDTADSISLYFYGSPLYYWCILSFNDLNDPYAEIPEGKILRIPTFTNIEFDLGE